MISRNIGFRFTLVSYNILSHSLLHDHGHLYVNCSPKDLEWPKRGHKIVSELLNNKADIICLQEVEQRHLRTLYQPKLAQSGYECLYKKKTGYKIDGCAIFYKSSLFDLLNHKGIEFKRTDLTKILDRDNVGIIAVLKPKSSPTTLDLPKIVIANTHLIFNPQRCDIRLAQLKLFLSELNSISENHESEGTNNKAPSHCPTILCGDFNCEPDSDVVKFILKDKSDLRGHVQRRSVRNIVTDIVNDNDDDSVTGQIAPDDDDCLSDPSHPFEFKSVYSAHNKSGKPYISTFDGCIVDYIFYTTRLTLESYLELLTDEELKEMNPLPNSDHPSDHIPLEARFLLKPDSGQNTPTK